MADLCVAFGGRIAEELIFGHDKVTTGAMSDIEQATRMVRAMVTRFGMSDELGPIAYAENQEEVFLGHSVSRQQNVSEQTAQKIDSEIRRIVDDTYKKAKEILTTRLNDLHTLARGLLEYETLTGDEIVALLKGIPPVRTPYEEPETPRTPPQSTVPTVGRPRGPAIPVNPEPQPGNDILNLSTLRSNDQFNTTIYGYSDRFRGVEGTRQVVFMNGADIGRLGLANGDPVDLVTAIDESRVRSVSGLRIVAYDIPEGCCAAYYPECNPLFPLSHHDPKAKTPGYKLLPVHVRRAAIWPSDRQQGLDRWSGRHVDPLRAEAIQGTLLEEVA